MSKEIQNSAGDIPYQTEIYFFHFTKSIELRKIRRMIVTQGDSFWMFR